MALVSNNFQTSVDEMPDDILLHIFSLNTNMADDDCEPHYRALYVTRCTSQVSRRWRILTLGSPMIWANLIDLEIFRTNTAKDWREEVLRRSGTSLLSVKVHGDWRAVKNELLLSFLDKYWDRIQTLNIHFSGLKGSFDGDAWLNILCRPSPLFRSFDFRIGAEQFYELLPDHTKSNILSSSHAPSNLEFHKSAIPTFMPVPWLSQLGVLELNFKDRNHWIYINVAHILSRLEGMNALGHLIIHLGNIKWSVNDRAERIRLVDLPSLRLMDITSPDSKQCALLLENIVPQQGCSLFLNAYSLYYDDHPYIPAGLIAQYSNNYFNFGGIVPRSIEFRFLNRIFQFAAYVESWSFTPFDISGYGYSQPNYLDRANKSRCPDPDFNIEIMDPSLSAVDLRLTSLNPIILSIPVAALRLVTAFKLFTSEGYLTKQKVDSMVFIQLMESLTSVETLATTTNSLIELTVLGIGHSTLPSLRTLTMMDSLNDKGKEEYAIHPIILEFLQLRAEAGLPIEVFDVRTVDEDPHWRKISLQCLEVMSGLKVVWRGDEEICEYVCGTGNPGVLDFIV